MAKRILIVDDDPVLRRSVAFDLEQAGYDVLAAHTAEDGLAIIQNHPPDLILLDVGLPGMDGWQALRVFQREIAAVPTIFVTARRRDLDEIVGLELGADDYVTKPFDTDVLIAHIKAVLRRTSDQPKVQEQREIAVGDLRISPASRNVWIGNRQVKLTPKEFEILLALAQVSDNVLSNDDLISRVWGAQWVGEIQTIYVHVRWLREKIEHDPTNPRRLLTVKGTGYKLVAISEDPPE